MSRNNTFRQRILAVVGPIASGKNLVSKILEKNGFLAIDADQIAHLSIEENKDTILKTFQSEANKAGILLQKADGTIDRKALGSILFANSELLQRQESIVHPYIDAKLNNFIDENPQKNIVLNATVLYKTPVINRCDKILYVKSPLILRFFRILKRDSLPICQIIRRIRSQKKLFSQYKNLNADILIVRNYNSIQCLEARILKLLHKIF